MPEPTCCRFRPAFALPALALLAAACGDDSGPSPESFSLSPDAVVEYEFRDSSVPPEFHRSYTLTVSRDEVHVIVDSYGDVIGETTEPLPSEVWDGLVDNVHRMAAVEPSDADQSGCAGGRGRGLTVTDGAETLLDLNLYLCRDRNGDRVNVEQADQLDTYVQPVIDSIPDWDLLFD